MTKCCFCGYAYDETEAASGCKGCPVKAVCGKIRCPNCGYEMPKEPGLVKLLGNMAKRKSISKREYYQRCKNNIFNMLKRKCVRKPYKEKGAERIPRTDSNAKPTCLADLKKGQGGMVTGLETEDEGILKKLMSMGVMPGTPLKVIQTYPSCVFQVGYTQIAVDADIAGAILVNR